VNRRIHLTFFNRPQLGQSSAQSNPTLVSRVKIFLGVLLFVGMVVTILIIGIVLGSFLAAVIGILLVAMLAILIVRATVQATRRPDHRRE
jgi:hypothetical protein